MIYLSRDGEPSRDFFARPRERVMARKQRHKAAGAFATDKTAASPAASKKGRRGVELGRLKLNHGLILAPMAGFTDRAMRLVCHGQGAEYTVTEMVSAKAIVYGDRKTCILGRIAADEGPVGLQLFGSDPDVMARATERASLGFGGEGYVPPVAIDINMGCPVKKIFDNGEGSALMRDPELIYRIVMATVESTDLPVTVKMRRGIKNGEELAVECALAAESAGAAMVCVHGRTRAEMYSGRADREIIKKVKNSLRIPVVANGDVTSASEALSMLRETGADGLAIGRGAIGNPFVFAEIAAALSADSYTPPTLRERGETALAQLRYAVLDKGEGVAVREARGQLAFYFRGFRGAAHLRGEINRATSFCEVEALINGIVDCGGEYPEGIDSAE